MKKNLSDNLARTIAETGGLELPAEILEFSIDQAIDEGLLKDIPVVGWIAKGASFGRSISDRIFFHKILRFLIALEKIDKNDREAFRTKVAEDSDFRRRVGEHLLILLDKMDTFEKSSLLAKCFDHFLTGDIDHGYFVDLSHVIERSPLADLQALCVPDNQRIQFRSSAVAAASGILEFGIAEPEPSEDLPQLGTRMSPYGRDLRDMFLGRFRDRQAKEKKRREQLLNQLKERVAPVGTNDG